MPPDIEATLTRLRTAFIAQLPSRLAVLERLLARVAKGEAGATEMLHHAAHSLVGAAGVHRLMDVAEAARRLESLVAGLTADTVPDAPKLFALHKALARLANEAEHPARGFVPPQSVAPAQRVVILEPDADAALALRDLLEGAGYSVEVFNSLADCQAACARPRGERPAALVMEMVFPEGDDAGARFLADMRAGRLCDVPVIFLSARDDAAARLAAHRAGVAHYLAKPVDGDLLLHTLANLRTAAAGRPWRVVVVDGDPAQAAASATVLREAGMEVREATNPLDVPALLDTFAAEALVTELDLPGCSGPELAGVVHGDGRHELLPVLYLAADPGRASDHELDGEVVLAKPVPAEKLVAAVVRRARRHRQTRDQLETLRATLYERERHQHAVDAHAIVSITDTAGTILYVNDKFC